MVQLRMILVISHKDAQEGGFEVHYRVQSMQSLMNKWVRNGSSNGRSDASLEGALDGGLNVGFEWAP